MIVLPKVVDGEPRKGRWYLWKGRVFLCCPECAVTGELRHPITADGTVTKKVTCPTPNCFDDVIRLQGWRDGRC